MVMKNLLAAIVAAAMLHGPAQGQHHHADGGDQAKRQPANSPAAANGEAGAEAGRVGPHGGALDVVAGFQVETLIAPDGLRNFVYDAQGRPVDLREARGVATLQVQGDSKRYRYELFPELRQDKSAVSLAVGVDLSQIAGQQINVDYQLAGLSPGGRQLVRFQKIAVAPGNQRTVASTAAEQKVCPVSRQPLGSMGEPVAVEVGGQTVYVCCAGCINALKADPAKYGVAQAQLKVAPATEADAAAIALQKTCPVMDEPLGSMGAPLKVTGLARDVFLCCKGCVKFLEREPQKYLAKLPPAPGATKPQVVKATKVDEPFAAAQQTCPVMDEPLGAMGGPWKTVVEGKIVYLCCPGCAKKLHADPQLYLAALARRGVAPPDAR